MYLSRLFGNTLRESPADADIASHQLLLRAGFIRPLANGIFSYLPLARRSLNKIETILRQEIGAINGQEVTMPVVHTADPWKETGRYYQIGSEMGRFKDKNGHEMVLAMTHEEIVADLVRSEIHSYKQLPALLYQIQTKWRDDPRPRAGLIRVREFTMLDSYSLDSTWEGLDTQYQAHYQAYFRIFDRCGLPVVAVQSDSGMMGGSTAHEYMYLTPVGEDSLLFCNSCGYSANRQVAQFRRAPAAQAAWLPQEKVHTPGITSIQELTTFLNISAAQTAKAVFFMASTANQKEGEKQPDESFIFAVIRGDLEINETKLANALHATELRPATSEEILATGAVPGFASPIGLKNVTVIVDESIPASTNLVAGANEVDYHLLNVNFGRDFSADQVIDIAAAGHGFPCPHCGSPMELKRGVEVGNIFKLGTRYSDALGCTFLDEQGKSLPVIMGSYGIGVGRLLACIAEEHHDERGLAWPVEVAPYPIHMIVLGSQNAKVMETAQELYRRLEDSNMEALYDDRSESAGIKFMDADLIGLPLRITVSERSLKQGGVEFKRRTSGESWIVPIEQARDEARKTLG